MKSQSDHTLPPVFISATVPRRMCWNMAHKYGFVGVWGRRGAWDERNSSRRLHTWLWRLVLHRGRVWKHNLWFYRLSEAAAVTGSQFIRAKVNKDLFSSIIYRKKPQQPLKAPLDTCCLPRWQPACVAWQAVAMAARCWPYCLFCCFAPLWYTTQPILGGLCGSAGVRGRVKAARVQSVGAQQMGPAFTPNVGSQTGSHRGEEMVGGKHEPRRERALHS